MLQQTSNSTLRTLPLTTADVLDRLVVVRLADSGTGFDVTHVGRKFEQDRERLQAATALDRLGEATLPMDSATFHRMTMRALLVDLAEHPQVQRHFEQCPDEPLVVVEPDRTATTQPRVQLRRPILR